METMNMNFMFFLPIICGITAANVYYIQPLIPIVQETLSISYTKASMLYSLSLLGNGLALFFIVPIGDFINKKQLILIFYSILTLSQLIFYFNSNYFILALMSFILGIGSSVIPLIISSVSNNENGSIYIGRIMAGVLIGILSSRFLSSEIGAVYGWKSIYILSSTAMLISLLFIYHYFPKSIGSKNHKENYLKILKSTIKNAFENKFILFHCISGFVLMFIFTSFWSNVSSYLTTLFNFNKFDIGIFSLTGIAGASSAYFSSIILKKINYNNKVLYILLMISLLIMAVYSNFLLVAITGAILIDAFIQLLHVNNQRNLYTSCKGKESQVASSYMSFFVIGGALGGLVTSYIYQFYGWSYILILCSIVSLCSLFLISKENKNG
ncbi:MFS transporter [Salmonella enterica subsp. enterica serovar Bareilly]|nr:MFS transporter [Salmonella enterica subsp. enterica serovar Bareilly]EAP2905252.1 MFS transporter [Salmonella enterica]EAP6381386.1 MFS transporter [Salmonella enterica]EAP9909590.1 MFS transporter [Salmonella enterica]EBU7455589.1 MFS transporter [Salmonella enterica subsp. enterica serovar Bareilly]